LSHHKPVFNHQLSSLLLRLLAPEMLSKFFHLAAVAVEEDWNLKRILLKIIVVFGVRLGRAALGLTTPAFGFVHVLAKRFGLRIVKRAEGHQGLRALVPTAACKANEWAQIEHV
jgi:hypothetical protein